MNISKVLTRVILLVVILQLTILPTQSMAAEEKGIFSRIFDNASSFIQAGYSASSAQNTELTTASNNIFTLISGIASAVAVIVGGILGIQFIIASAEEKAKIKEAMIPYIIGCVVIFGALGIWKLAVDLLNQLNLTG